MKKLLMVVLFIALATSLAWAEESTTYFYPTQENAEFSVVIPDSWNVETQETGDTVQLIAAKEEGIAFIIQPLAAKDVDKIDQETWDSIVDEPIQQSFTDIEYAGEPEEETINDIEFWSEYATAKWKEDGEPMSLRVSIFFPSEETTCLLYAFANEEGLKKYNDELTTIIQSIKPAE